MLHEPHKSQRIQEGKKNANNNNNDEITVIIGLSLRFQVAG